VYTKNMPPPPPQGENVARHDLGENTSLGIRKRRKFDKKEERGKRKGEFNLKGQNNCTSKGMKGALKDKYLSITGEGKI
jgi:hypothetical protein